MLGATKKPVPDSHVKNSFFGESMAGGVRKKGDD
jgi:hypothetical protein